jgi:hypothetical protein
MGSKEVWKQQIEPDSELTKTGVIITTLLPKRKDGLYGISLVIPEECMAENNIEPNTAEIFTTLTKPEGYVFRVTINDKDLGTHITTNEADNPLFAFEKAKLTIKRLLVDSEAQTEAMRIEDEGTRILDMAENAAIAERVYNAFRYDIESIEISCVPTSWSFAEREEQ